MSLLTRILGNKKGIGLFKLIPQIQPWIDSTELEYLKKVVDSTWVTEHALTEEFENRIKDLTGAKHAIAVCNGTAALFCCLKALGVGPGDEVIVPNLTFIATSNAVIMAGAHPVLCDVGKDFSLDLTKAEECLSEKTKAIMPVHLYGMASEMDSILDFAKQHKLKVIEDAAQGVAVHYKGRHVGTFGELGILSFYGNKTMTCGEGGIILTDNDDLAEKCYRLKNHGRSNKGVFDHEDIGFNFAFTEMQAAVGLAQLDKLPRIVERKQEIFDRYSSGLSELKGKLSPVRPETDCVPVYWFTSFLTQQPETRRELEGYLKEKGIQTRAFFTPLDQQPCYRDKKWVLMQRCSMGRSHSLHECGISLPSSYGLTDSEQDLIIEAVKEFFE